MFLPRFLRLLASIAWEGVFNFVCLLASLLPGQRASIKNRMKAAMTKTRNAALLMVTVSLLFLAAGCSSCPKSKPLGADLAESFYLLRETTDPIEELSRDFNFIFGPEWGEFMDTICRLSQ